MSQKLRIAVLTRAGFAYHLSVGWGFFEKIEKFNPELKWRPILFFCKEANEEVMREQMDEIYESKTKYDLIISIGAIRTYTAYQYIKEKKWDIPLVFAGVTDPIKLGLLKELKPEKNITGVIREHIDLCKVAILLCEIKPTIKKLLIPYQKDAENGLVEERLYRVQRLLSHKGITTTLFPLEKVQNFPEVLKSIITSFDTLWVTEGNFMENFNHILIELCNEHQVTFFSNNIEGAKKGAALSFGEDLNRLGYALFKQVYKILEEQVPAENLPIIITPNEREIHLNLEASKLQNLQVPSPVLSCLENGKILEE